MSRLLAAFLLVLAACMAAAETAAPPEEAPLGRAPAQPAIARAFIAAMERVRTNLPEPPDPPALKNYPIYDYLVAARLRRDLGAASNEAIDSAIDAFLRGHAGQPVARALRHQWLASLAQRRRWDLFLPRSIDVADPQLICDRLAGRLAIGDTHELSSEALAHWSMPQRQPQECAAVFAWLRAQGLVTPALEETRARAALMADNAELAHEIAAELPAERAAPLMQWVQLLEAPKSSLERLAMAPASPVEPEALLAGFTRLARTDAAAAVTLLPPLLARPDATPALQGRLRRAAALGAAYAREPGAVAAFSKLSAGIHRYSGAGMARARRALGRRLWQGARMEGADARRASRPSPAGAIGTPARWRRPPAPTPQLRCSPRSPGCAITTAIWPPTACIKTTT